MRDVCLRDEYGNAQRPFSCSKNIGCNTRTPSSVDDDAGDLAEFPAIKIIFPVLLLSYANFSFL